jgi:hypothetical protein
VKPYLIDSFVFIFLIGLGVARANELVPGGSNPLSGESLYADVIKYAGFGIHRTAMPGDSATSQWIAEELKKAGLQVTLRPWKLKQFFLENCELKVDGQKIDSFPGWYPKTDPVRGPLALYDPSDMGILKGRIAYAGLEYGRVSNTGLLRLLETVRSKGAIGLVVACRNFGDSGLLTAANAEKKNHGPEYYQSPLPIPVAIVAGNEDGLMIAAAKAGKEASIKINGQTKEATAYNVVGVLKRGEKWVVITTPSSGWFTCGGERGPGVALLLGLARWAAKSDSKTSYIFIANSGHEMAYMGAHAAFDEYLPEHKITKDNVACWFHLGAAIACRRWRKTGDEFIFLDEPNKVFYLAAVPGLIGPVKESFGGVKGLTMGSGNYAGELTGIVKGGFKACGFFGANYFFHTKEDTQKETSPAFLKPVGEGMAQFFKTLESMK